MFRDKITIRKMMFLPLFITAVPVFYFLSVYSYLLFHLIVETFSIFVCAGVFIIAWNTRHIISDRFYLFIGIAYLFVGLLDSLHTLSYKGMVFFPLNGADLATQLWIAARYLESLSLFAAVVLGGRKMRTEYVIGVYGGIVIILLVSIYLRVFPACYVEGIGLTRFKITSEYIISVILCLVIIQLHGKREFFEEGIVKLLKASIVLTIFSELAFTMYHDVYGFLNFVGHIFKFASFYLIYKALIMKCLKDPYRSIFRSLKNSEEKLEKLNKVKDKMFTLISHDLRGPLGSVERLMDLINTPGLSEKDKQNVLRSLSDQAKETSHLLENLLTWAMSQQDKVVCGLMDVDVRKVILENVNLLSIIAEKKKIKMRIETEGVFFAVADYFMLSTVARNLIMNSIKYTRENGEIAISIKELRKFIEVKVKDNGIGITPDHLEKLFFSTEHISTRGTCNEKGTGVGLSLCNDFIHRMGGEIGAESEPGNGSCFHFKIPRPENKKQITVNV